MKRIVSCFIGRHILPFSSILETHVLEIEARHTVFFFLCNIFLCPEKNFPLGCVFQNWQVQQFTLFSFHITFFNSEKFTKIYHTFFFTSILMYIYIYILMYMGKIGHFPPKLFSYQDVIILLHNFNSVLTLYYLSSSQSDFKNKLER